jgi:hypothetical protein
MRHFSLPAGTIIPDHVHDWPHYNDRSERVHGFVIVEGKPLEIPPMGWAHVPGRIVHGYENPDLNPSFSCAYVPTEGDPHMKLKRFRMERSKSKFRGNRKKLRQAR